MRFGLDSTDSRQGGCTTHVAARILAALPEYVVRSAPHLVRLNPNVPYKTRGNGALAFDLGHPEGPTRPIGHIDGRPIHAAPRIRPLTSAQASDAFQRAAAVVARERSPDSDSCLIAFDAPPPAAIYWDAVQRNVEPTPLRPRFEKAWGNARGRIGATAAAAWPAQAGTWEAIAYRDASRIGTPRDLDPALGPRLASQHPQTFDSWDPEHQHLRIAPASPCPVLAGIRATDADAALAALRSLGPETPAGWLLFWTNQATGDHLRDVALSDARAYDCLRATVTVRAEPHTRPGGHVFVPITDGTTQALAAAYEPTKGFRNAVRRLQPGDRIQIEGALHQDPSLIALEAFTLLAAAPNLSLDAPACTICGGPTRSTGRRGGYRCGSGHSLAPAHAPRVLAASQTIGVRTTVPIAIRRHLSRPNGIEPVGATDQTLEITA
jgi:tRNA(Ile2)-agmatinylcytidine synthase